MISLYGPIVMSSIFLGIICACILMNKAGAKRVTVLYTALFTFVCIIVVSIMTSFVLSGNILQIGFVGAGGALGLIVGAVTSALIHRDHTRDSLSAWIIVAPLMYGLAKIGCHTAGCCKGMPYDGPLAITYEEYHGSFFPVQLTETVVFVIIFIVGAVLYIKAVRGASGNSSKAAMIVIMLSAIAKIGLEFLRESHVGVIISGYQILIFVISVIAAISLNFVGKLPDNPVTE